MRQRFEPEDPDYEARVRASFERQSVMKTLDVSIERLAPGEVDMAFPHRADLTQQHGFVHAGIISTVLDSACGYAAFSLMPKEAAVLTVEFKINFLAPASGERFLARGRVRRTGRTITVTEGEMFATTGDSSKLIATMLGTIMAVYDQVGIDG